jgi:hypothetical protein
VTKLLRAAFVVVLLVAGLMACSTGSKPPGAVTVKATRTLTPPDTSVALLFVARSESGSLRVRPGNQSTLELNDVAAMTWFSDRPARDAGTSSVTDALKTFGWKRNGDRLGVDVPNGALVAAELGNDSVVVKLLTATVDGSRVRFTVAFVGQPPESSGLSDANLFIDDTLIDPNTETPSGLKLLASGGIVLGRTIDQLGKAHTLVLHLTRALEKSVVTQNAFLAVISGSSTYSVTGDVAGGDWRLSVDTGITGDAAPIVVLKFRPGALATLAQDRSVFDQPQVLNDDVAQTQARLNAVIAIVMARAGSRGPDSAFYTSLASSLQDPNWDGVLIFNTSVSGLPGEVQGQSTAALAGTQIHAIDIGFPHMSNGAQALDSFFGTVDDPGAPSDSAQQPSSPAMRALFKNSALTAFHIGN